MVSLFLRNLLFTILQPGIVAGLLPWLLLKKNHQFRFDNLWQRNHFAGAAIFITGVSIMLSCIFLFAAKGRGTLSPADPTKKLVISGLYKYSRNPMYVGVILILTGETIFFWWADLLIYSSIIFFAFNLFIRFKEEPRLRKDFGTEYADYCKTVRRWL